MLTTYFKQTAPQPDPKQRRTLMERAVEYPEKHSVVATPAPRTINKGVSLASQTGVSSLPILQGTCDDAAL